MIRLGVVGLGTIFPAQRAALAALKEDYCLAAVCDADPARLADFARSVPAGSVRLYQRAEALFQDDTVDAVLIATPPASHFSLALEGLRRGKHILLEKPAVVEPGQLKTLCAQAENSGPVLQVAYHAAFARDLDWYLTLAPETLPGREDISSITCGFFDPYLVEGALLPGREALGGCYLDSGVNALSVCARLADLDLFTLARREVALGPESLPRRARHLFRAGERAILLHTGWDQGLNHKSTLLTFRTSPCRVLLDHSAQAVYLLRDGRRELVFAAPREDRLTVHYRGVFAAFAQALATGAGNLSSTRSIHRLLLSGL